ncbi:hypothetical protein [Embleya sp. NBC_00896]|uniref:hypothetical protein n=1 Tax=Embleya sp. NBC_00896 TaxID=2975961 RepID=UPI00386D89E4|nr:hypothetical protein OG928_31265 [Embleya sp. NBC_00896]
MAQHIALTCDWCDLFDLPDEPAVVSRVLALDGPPRTVDLCGRCDVELARLHALYDRGRDLPDEPRRDRAGGRARAGTEAVAPAGPEAGASVAEVRPKPTVLCPLPHPSADGGPLRVTYAHRGNHADMVHHGSRIWDIEWEDPDGILTNPCTEHEACSAHHLSFTTPKGLTAHINACPLPRLTSEPAA